MIEWSGVMHRMSGWAQFLVIVGAFLQFGGLWLTVRQVQLVIGIRATLREQLRAGGQRLLGRKSATVHVATARAHTTLGLDVHAEVRIPGESEVDRLDREVKHHDRLFAELRSKLAEVDRRMQWALDDRLEDFNREIDATARRNAVLMWWGVVLVGTGIIMQTVGSLI
ncbi:hypothetical protein ACWDT5_09850 [Rhodococcus aetherivorans]